MVASRGVYSCFCEVMAGNLFKVILPILLRKDRAMEVQIYWYCSFTTSCPLTKKCIPDNMRERWKKEDSSISDFIR